MRHLRLKEADEQREDGQEQRHLEQGRMPDAMEESDGASTKRHPAKISPAKIA